MSRRAVARMLLFVGGLAAAVAWWGFAAQQTLLDPGATRDAAVGLLSAPSVQRDAVDSLADQIVKLIPQQGGKAVLAPAQAQTFSRDAATVALRDPALREAFGNAIASLQQQLIDGDASQHGLTVDTSAVTQAARNAVTNVDPSIAARIPNAPLTLRFDTTRLPSLRGVDQHTNSATWIAALIAIAAWCGAVFVHPEPWTAVRVVGRRLFVIGGLPLVFWVLIPWGLRALHMSAADIVSPIASAYGRRLAPPAFTILGIGAALWIAGHVAEWRGRGASGSGGRASGGRAIGIESGASGAQRTERLERVDVRA